MDEHRIVEVAEQELSFWDQHRFLLLIALTILVASALVSISLVIYNVSGASQLDLSRPGYQSVSSQVEESIDTSEYSAFGPVNESTVNEFTNLYDEQADRAKAVDAFNGDPLNPEVLESASPTASE